VHLVVDALGLPLVFAITEGQRHDSQPAKELLHKAESRCLLADKAYDSDDLRSALSRWLKITYSSRRRCIPTSGAANPQDTGSIPADLQRRWSGASTPT